MVLHNVCLHTQIFLVQSYPVVSIHREYRTGGKEVMEVPVGGVVMY